MRTHGNIQSLQLLAAMSLPGPAVAADTIAPISWSISTGAGGGRSTAQAALIRPHRHIRSRTVAGRCHGNGTVAGGMGTSCLRLTLASRAFGWCRATDHARSLAWSPGAAAQSLDRTATVIASGIGGFPAIVEAVRTTDRRGIRRLSPFTVPSFLVNLAAGHISIHYGYKGPLGAPVTACAAGVQAIGDATRLIRAGEADIAICGGTEACIDLVSLGGFAAARALSTGFNDAPARASRPFDRDRNGFVMGEGAGILVIEELQHALARKATPIAEVIGYGTSADAYHVTSGPENGEGAARAMQLALRQAGVAPADVQHLNAHSTSTPVGDSGELEAIKTVFGRDRRIAVSATKSATGHLLGAAGGAIFTILALRDQIAPPTLNLETGSACGRRRSGRRRSPEHVDHACHLERLRFRRRQCKHHSPPMVLTSRRSAISLHRALRRSAPDVAVEAAVNSRAVLCESDRASLLVAAPDLPQDPQAPRSPAARRCRRCGRSRRTPSLPVRSIAFQSARDLVRRHPVLRVQQNHGIDLARRKAFQELPQIGVHRNDQAGAVAHAVELAALQIRRQAAVAGTGIAAMQRLPGEIIGFVGMAVDQAQQPFDAAPR